MAADDVPEPPRGLARLAWLGSGFLWMVSAAGSGELLFTPRVGSLFGYGLVWALAAAVGLQWAINREVGRCTVCTGRTLLEGFARLPGPRGWAVWLILAPQAFVAVATVAGLAGGAATAVALALPGPLGRWTLVTIASATALILGGRYHGVERVAMVLAVALAVAAVAAAATVFPGAGELAAGLAPAVPTRAQLPEVLPWIGFALSGAAGLVWYSYWLRRKGYGATGARVHAGSWSTVLSGQDGWGRMYANGTRLVTRKGSPTRRWLPAEGRLKGLYVVGLTALAPMLLYLLLGTPVALLKAAGAIEAAHIPVVAWTALLLNRRELHEDLRPTVATSVLAGLAGLFFAAFAPAYLLLLLGVR